VHSFGSRFESESESGLEFGFEFCWVQFGWCRPKHNYYLSSSVQNAKLVARSEPTHSHTHKHLHIYIHIYVRQANRRHMLNRKGKRNEWRRRDRNEGCTPKTRSEIEYTTKVPCPLSPLLTVPLPSPSHSLSGCVWALRQWRRFQCWQNSLEQSDGQPKWNRWNIGLV